MIRYLKNIPIVIEQRIIFINLFKNILLNLNKSLFRKLINNTIELNQDDIVVAIGIIMKPTLLK